MPTPTKGTRLGGSPAHQRLILANLATSLFEHGRITTTETKAKRLRPFAEHLVTKAKRGDQHARRQVMSIIRDKTIVHELFTEIGPRYAERPGGYTRITKIGPRKGDNAPMAVIELVTEEYEPKSARTAKPAAPDRGPAETPDADLVDSSSEGPYGPDSALSAEDGSSPEGFTVKGNEDSKKFHGPDSPWFDRTNAEVWFRTAEAAEAAGFVNAVHPTEDEADPDSDSDKA